MWRRQPSALTQEGKITDELINCRVNGDFKMVPANEIDYLDVSPKQIVCGGGDYSVPGK